MSYKIGLLGTSNSGKSYSRRTIRDGENVFIIQPSMKAPHLFTGPTDKRVPVGMFDLITKAGNMKQTQAALKAPSINHVIDYINNKFAPGTIQKDALKGNIQHLKDAINLPIWLKFIDIHLPWIHTVIISDFTHFISKIISQPEFINRKAGGEAFQRYLELASEALNNFIIGLDDYRSDLLIATEYHAEYDTDLRDWRFFVPAGKMLTEKFKPETYYDVLLQSEVKIRQDLDGKVINKDYSFVTESTLDYPFARAMNLFDLRIPNDLQLVLDKVREYLGMSLPQDSF